MLRSVEGAIHVKAPPALVYSILAGFERYRRWVPDVTSSRVYAREGGVGLAELIVPPYGNRKLLLEFVESPHDWLTFQEVDRFRQYGLSGRWELEPVDGDRGVVVRALLQLKGGVRQLGSRGPMRAVLDRTLEALATRALQLSAAGVGGDARERRKILEIRRREDAVEVQLGERVYVAEEQVEKQGR